MTRPTSGSQQGAELAFDLNIERVLEHWTVAFAIRELIANALDEHAITATPEPEIFKDDEQRWHIRDRGRGLRYEHLTQKEDAEKRRHPEVIGQFGMGLKDALAVLDRRNIGVQILSPHADMTTGRRPKAAFSDIITLQALVSPPSHPTRTGTEIVLTGARDDDVAAARGFFLRYSGEQPLESTEYGDVLSRLDNRRPSRIYVKGLLVAEEPNFLFSYNITKLSAPLRRALNRERSNVGRGAYSERVKTILTSCISTEVAGRLAHDLTRYTSGGLHDELGWREVALHACRVLQTNEKVIFVTAWQMAEDTAQMRYARDDGYRVVVVPEDIARSLGKLADLQGNPLVDLDRYRTEWNDSFSYIFVETDYLTPVEQSTLARTPEIGALVGTDLARDKITVRISERMRLNETGDPVLGVWEASERRIVIRRDQLAGLSHYAGTLLHEIGHALSGSTDGTLEFESELSRLLGQVAATALSDRGRSPRPASAS
jgi:hypothetical protein